MRSGISGIKKSHYVDDVTVNSHLFIYLSGTFLLLVVTPYEVIRAAVCNLTIFLKLKQNQARMPALYNQTNRTILLFKKG